MGLILILSLLFWGWAEMSTFIYVGNEIGGLLTLLGVFVTAIVGMALLKNQGLSVLNRIRNDLTNGQSSVSSVADSIALIIGGVLMLIPGYLTDILGLFLFVPGLRTFAGIYSIKWIMNHKKFNGFVNVNVNAAQSERKSHSKTKHRKNPLGFNQKARQNDAFDEIIEGDFEERESPKSQLQHNKTKKL